MVDGLPANVGIGIVLSIRSSPFATSLPVLLCTTDRHGRRGRSTAHIFVSGTASPLSSTPPGSATEGGQEANGIRSIQALA